VLRLRGWLNSGDEANIDCIVVTEEVSDIVTLEFNTKQSVNILDVFVNEEDVVKLID
jgi:hypothetical protein